MPVLRSATRKASTEAIAKPLKKVVAKSQDTKTVQDATKKRKPAKTKNVNVSVKKALDVENVGGDTSVAPVIPPPGPAPPPPLPAVLSFSFDDAKAHLFTADPRFEDIFSKLDCRPFEHLETMDPFR